MPSPRTVIRAHDENAGFGSSSSHWRSALHAGGGRSPAGATSFPRSKALRAQAIGSLPPDGGSTAGHITNCLTAGEGRGLGRSWRLRRPAKQQGRDSSRFRLKTPGGSNVQHKHTFTDQANPAAAALSARPGRTDRNDVHHSPKRWRGEPSDRGDASSASGLPGATCSASAARSLTTWRHVGATPRRSGADELSGYGSSATWTTDAGEEAGPRVVHCKRERYDVYVGRGRGSRWGNPFKSPRDGSRDEVIAKYERWLVTPARADGGPARASRQGARVLVRPQALPRRRSPAARQRPDPHSSRSCAMSGARGSPTLSPATASGRNDG